MRVCLAAKVQTCSFVSRRLALASRVTSHLAAAAADLRGKRRVASVHFFSFYFLMPAAKMAFHGWVHSSSSSSSRWASVASFQHTYARTHAHCHDYSSACPRRLMNNFWAQPGKNAVAAHTQTILCLFCCVSTGCLCDVTLHPGRFRNSLAPRLTSAALWNTSF